MTELFLQTGMAVVPEGARLLDRELVMIGFTWPDAGEADARHPVHLEGQEQPMPVDRAVFVQRIGDVEADRTPFLQAQQRRRSRAVDGDRFAGPATDAERTATRTGGRRVGTRGGSTGR